MDWNKTSKFRDNIRLSINFVLVMLLLGMWLASSLVFTLDSAFPVSGDAQMVLVSALMGVYFSRWATAALLIVLLPGKLLFRTILATLLFGGEAMLAALTFSQLGPVAGFLAIPLIVIAFAVPFEISRVFWDARLAVDWFDFSQRRQLGLGGLMMRVTMAAVLMGVLQFCDQDDAIGLLASTVVLAMIGTIVLLPFTTKVMAGRHRFLSFLGCLIFAFLLSFGGVCLIEHFTQPMNAWQRSFIPVGTAMFLTSYGLALLVLIRFGMRLEFGTAGNTTK